MRPGECVGRRAVLAGVAALLVEWPAAAVADASMANCQLVFPNSGPVLIFVVDRTAPRSRVLNEKILESAARAVQPGTRLVLWAFGGVRPLPELLLDITLPMLVDRPVSLSSLLDAATQPSGAGDARRVCETAELRKLSARFVEALKAALADFDARERGQSPVLLAINTALAPFQREAVIGGTTLLVATDGFEFSGAGGGALSLYPGADGRFLTPAQVTARAQDAFPAMWTGARIHMTGLGNASVPDPKAVTALQAIWRTVISSRGGRLGELSVGAVQRLEEPR